MTYIIVSAVVVVVVGGTTAGSVMKQIIFNNERKLLHITKYYTCFREPYFLMNSLINLIQTMCIIWS